MLVFLFTDIEGSTPLWEAHTDEMGEVIARHDAILQEQVGGCGGRITKHTGDGITAVFEGGEPVACALETQKRFAAEPWRDIGELRIRAGLHAGEAVFQASAGTPEGDYFGPPVNATARVMSAAWGGQTLLTPEVTRVSPLPAGATLVDLGEHLLKGVSAPQRLYQLDHPQLQWHAFPPPRTLSGQSIRQAVDEWGSQLARLDPTGMVIGLVAAILVPALQGELDPGSGALEGNLGVLADVGAGTLRTFVVQFAEWLRVRQQGGEVPRLSEIWRLLDQELSAQWQAGGETAAALRADASRLLQAVQGVEATVAAARGEVKEALARGLADLGEQFGEFRWMLAGVQQTLAEMRARQAVQLALQREQLDLQREQLAKTDLILRRRKEEGPVAEADIDVAGGLLPADVASPVRPRRNLPVQPAPFAGREEELDQIIAGHDVIIGSAEQPTTKIPEPPKPLGLPDVTGFVGREEELSYFSHELETQHLAVISGFAGTGKTKLAAMLVRQLAEPDRAFWYSFHEGEEISGIIWGLAGFLYWHDQQDLWHMLQGAQGPGRHRPPFEILLDYLLQMLRGRGYLICLDDFQFVDDDPLLEEWVGRLDSVVAVGELSIIITSRRVPGFVSLGEFEPLKGLSASDTRLLLDERGLSLCDDLMADLYAYTDGNAQLLTLAIDVLQHASTPADLIARLSESDNIERYLMSEIDAGLSGDERAVMSAIAVLLGYPGTRDAIEAVLDNQEGIRSVLSDLARRFLLTVSEGAWGREYGHHAIMRDFYYEMPGRRERQVMHGRAGEYYETEEPDALKAARHFERAGDNERAARLATADVWEIINEGQGQLLQQLLEEFTAQQLDNVQWAQVNVARGQVYTLLGEGQLGRESYEEALSRLEALPDSLEVRELRARTCLGMGELLQHEVPADALDWLHRGLGALGEASSIEKAALLIKAGEIQVIVGDHAAALQALEKGMALLPEGPSRLRARALNNLGTIYCIQGDIERGRDHYLRVLEIDGQLHDYWGMVETRHNLAIEMEIAGRWADAADYYQQALAEARRLGSLRQQAREELALGILRTNQGEYEAAGAHLSRCLEIAQEHNLKVHLVHAQPSLADLYLRQGDPDAAELLLADAERLALQISVRDPLPEIWRLRAQVELGYNRSEGALSYAERSVVLAGELSHELEEGKSLRVLGQALLATGQRGAATTAFERSLSLLADRDPYEAALTKAIWGHSL